MFQNTRNGPWYFHFFRACFNFVSKHFETAETFGLSQLSGIMVGQLTFSRACFNFVSKRFETNETLAGLLVGQST